MLRFLRIALELIAAFTGVIIVTALLLIWRLETSPLTSTFLTPYVESGIDTILPDTHTAIAHTVLTWNNVDHSIALHADGIQVIDGAGGVIAELPSMDIELSVFGLLLGQFIPKTLVVDHPQIQLERRVDGHLYFGGVSTSQTNSSDDIRDVLMRIANNLERVSITHALKISGVVLNIQDAKTQSHWAVNIPEITLERSGTIINGQALIDVTQENKTSTVNLYYNYNRKKELHTLSTHFSGLTPAFFAGGETATPALATTAIFDLPLSGDVSFAFDNQLNVETSSIEIHGGQGTLNAPDIWAKPRPVKSLDLKVLYDRPSNHLDIPLAALDFDGPKLNLSMTGSNKGKELTGLDFDLTVQMNNVPMDQFDELWPKPLVTDARDWLVTNITKGNYNHAEASFKGNLVWNDLNNINVTQGTGKILASGAQVNYLDGMPPVTGVNAEGTFDLTQMSVQISSGNVGNINIVPFTFQITDLDKDTQYMDIPLKLSGPIPDELRVLDAPPLGYTKALGLSPNDITGKMDGQVHFHFPLLKTLTMQDVDVGANANITTMASSKIVPGLDITQGNLALTLDKTGLKVNGTELINKIPFQISWQQNFIESANKPLAQGTISGPISGEQWSLLGLEALNGTHGQTAASFNIVQPNKSKTLLFGELNMTAAEVHIDQLNWKKPSGTAADLKFALEIPVEKNIIVKSIDLHGPQLAVKGNAVMTPHGDRFLSLDLKPMLIGRTNAALHFVQTEDGELQFNAAGDSFDVTGLKGGKDPAHTDPHLKRYQINISKLYTSNDGFISNAQGYALRDQEGWSEISLHGLAEGDHQLSVELTPHDDTHRVFSLTCDDFGKALEGMGFTDTVKEGKLEIHGASTVENPRVIDGQVKISSFTVKNLPVLALLLNATSPFGFGGILTDSASFDHLMGKFRWQRDTVDLVQTRAAGSAIGINIDGKVDMNTGDTNLHGTLVPFSMVNRFINYIPFLGNMLTGGEGQGVLAVAYKIDGTLGNPKISVNPVSLLTPGFLRNLFFNTGVDDNQTPPSDTPEPQPEP